MPYDKTNKRLYVDRSVTPNKGITPDEVAQCIKDFRKTRFGRDVGMLCASPNVNMWAKYKPERYPSPSIILTDLERSKNSYGIDMSMAHASTYDSLLTKAISNGCKYSYLKPRGAYYNEYFRLLDFDGYKHTAERPYRYTFVHIIYNLNGWMDVYLAPNADLMLSDINPTLLPSEDMSQCNLVLLYRKMGEDSGGGYIFPKIDGQYITLGDIETSLSAPVARFNMPGRGKYYFVAALTDATEGNIEDMFWMYLPDAIWEVEYDPTAIFKMEYPEDGSVSHTISPSSGGIGSVTVQLRLDAKTYEGGHGSLTIEIGEKSSDGIFDPNNSVYEYNWLEAGAVKNGSWTLTSSEGLSTDKMFIRAYIDFKDSDESLTSRRMYFDFLQGKQELNDPGAVSLKAIYDKWEW